MELALDFEVHSGRMLPVAPSAVLKAELMSLHKQAKLLRVALAVLHKHVLQGRLVGGELTGRANSLLPMGAGLMVGLTASPYFTRREETMTWRCETTVKAA